MRLAERILVRLSRDPTGPDRIPSDPWTGAGALDFLRREYPDFDARIAGRAVLDFGSGRGEQSIALVRAGAARVTGVELQPDLLKQAQERAAAEGVAGVVDFRDRVGEEQAGAYDVAISQNAMEHFADPLACLGDMARALRPGGVVLLCFGCPWYSPYGSHMHFFTGVPWLNLLFAERTVMAVRARYRDDGARRYEEAGLNRMSLAKLDRVLRASGLVVRERRERCVKGLPLARVPLLRELLVNQVTLVLQRNERS